MSPMAPVVAERVPFKRPALSLCIVLQTWALSASLRSVGLLPDNSRSLAIIGSASGPVEPLYKPC